MTVLLSYLLAFFAGFFGSLALITSRDILDRGFAKPFALITGCCILGAVVMEVLQ